MRITLVSIFIGIFYISAFSQKEPVYFMFISNSNETFFKDSGSGEMIKELTYRLTRLNDEKIIFFIKDLMFVYDKTQIDKDESFQINKNIEKKDFLLPEDVEKYIKCLQKKSPFGNKSGEFLNMFIAFENEDKTFKFYQVKWQYYIE